MKTERFETFINGTKYLFEVSIDTGRGTYYDWFAVAYVLTQTAHMYATKHTCSVRSEKSIEDAILKLVKRIENGK